MSHEVGTALAGVLIFATAVWVGGFVTIAVVARVASRILPAGGRVAFFRGLGRAYGVVGGCALAVAFGTGATLVYGRSWDGTLIATVVVAAALVAATAVGMAQAHHMTRLRRAALRSRDDTPAAGRVREGALVAAVLRVLIGVLSLALLALGVVLAG